MSEKRRSSIEMETTEEADSSEQSRKRLKSDLIQTPPVRFTSSCSITLLPSNNFSANTESTLEDSYKEFHEFYEDMSQQKKPQGKQTPDDSSRKTEELSHRDLTMEDPAEISNNGDKVNIKESNPDTGSRTDMNNSSKGSPSYHESEDREDTVEDLRNRISRMSLCRPGDVDTTNAQYYIVSYRTRKEISAHILSKSWSLGSRRFIGRQWNLGAGPVFLFFTVDPVRCYSGVGRLLLKTGSRFRIEWLRVIDMPRNRLDGSYLECPTMMIQEMDKDYGKLALETMLEYEAETEDKSVLDDIKDTAQTKTTVGLRNLGNTCYMNCVLQCLAKIPWNPHLLTNYKNNDFIREFFRLMDHLSEGIDKNLSNSPVEPHLLRAEIGKLSSRFATHQQQDAHELLLCLLSELRKATKNNESDKEIENPIQEHFGGKLRNSVKFECHHDINNDQSFYSVTLAIPEDYCRKGSVTIHEILDAFTKEEKMDDDNKAMCLSCDGQLKTCSIQTEFLHLPKILILHIQRFQVNNLRRLNTRIHFPLNGLKIKDLSGTVFEYNLFGVCNHFGSLQSGHYVAEVKSRRSNQWFSCSDSSVNEINLDSGKDFRGFVSSNSVSILFYEMN